MNQNELLSSIINDNGFISVLGQDNHLKTDVYCREESSIARYISVFSLGPTKVRVNLGVLPTERINDFKPVQLDEKTIDLNNPTSLQELVKFINS